MLLELDNDELAWLLGLAKAKRRRRERDAARMRPKPGQSRDEYRRAVQANRNALEWACSVEEHLIGILGDRDPAMLRDERDRKRYEELRAA